MDGRPDVWQCCPDGSFWPDVEHWLPRSLSMVAQLFCYVCPDVQRLPRWLANGCPNRWQWLLRCMWRSYRWLAVNAQMKGNYCWPWLTMVAHMTCNDCPVNGSMIAQYTSVALLTGSNCSDEWQRLPRSRANGCPVEWQWLYSWLAKVAPRNGIGCPYYWQWLPTCMPFVPQMHGIVAQIAMVSQINGIMGAQMASIGCPIM